MIIRLQRVLGWLRQGYPSGAPSLGYVPLIALLPRRLTEEEVRRIADDLARRAANGGSYGGASARSQDIGVSITRVTDELPSLEDIARVKHHLNTEHGRAERD